MSKWLWKTTFLKVIAGLLLPTDGTARILGFDLIKERAEVVKHVNYVAGLLTGGIWCDPNLPARKNLEAIAGLYDIPKSKVNDVLEFVGLSHVAESRVGTFSSGMAARLVVTL